jgi:hypothetical protein
MAILSLGKGDMMQTKVFGLLALVIWCSGCTTLVADKPKSEPRQAKKQSPSILVGTTPEGMTRYHGGGETVGKDSLTVFAVADHTRLQIGSGETLAHVDLDDYARLRLIRGLRSTLALCESARQGTVKGGKEVKVIDRILGHSGYSADSRGLLELAFSAITLPDGNISCADILELKKARGSPENPQHENFAAIHAIALSSLPQLIDLLEKAPNVGKPPPRSQGP